MKIVISSEIKNDVTTVKENIDNLSNVIKQIEPFLEIIKTEWNGEDATSFLKKYDEVLANLRKYEDELNNYYDFLSKVYDIFTALDEAYDKPIAS